VPVTATLLGVASLSAGLVAANRQRRIAEHRFRQVRQIANQFIALDADIRALPGSTTARHRIVSESLKYLEGLGAEARGDTELALEIATAHLQVAAVQGVPFVANLGEYAAAEQSLRTADTFVRAVLRADARHGRAWFIASQIDRGLMAVLDYQDRRHEALLHAERASRSLERFLKCARPTAEDINTATHIYLTVATAYNNSNRFGDAIQYSRRAADIAEGVDAASMRRASAFGVLSVSLRRTGDLEGALNAARQSRTLLEGLVAEGSTDSRYNLALAWFREGLVLDDDGGVGLGRAAEGALAFRSALEINRELAHRDPNDSRCRVSMGHAARQLADILRHQDAHAALSVYDEALAELRDIAPHPRADRERIDLLARSSYAARVARGKREAQDRLEQAFELLRATGGYPAEGLEPESEAFQTLRAQADHYAETDRLPQAIQTYRDLLQALSAWPLKMADDLRDAVAMSAVLTSLARLLDRDGRGQEARELLARRAAIWAPWRQKLPESVLNRAQSLAS
jgi:serine/threonine-protein kinase